MGKQVTPTLCILWLLVQALQSLWAQGATLKQGFTCTLEEAHVVLLVDTILHFGGGEGGEVGEGSAEGTEAVCDTNNTVCIQVLMHFIY